MRRDRQTDGYDKDNRPFSLLRERAGKVWHVTVWYVRNGTVFPNPQFFLRNRLNTTTHHNMIFINITTHHNTIFISPEFCNIKVDCLRYPRLRVFPYADKIREGLQMIKVMSLLALAPFYSFFPPLPPLSVIIFLALFLRHY